MKKNKKLVLRKKPKLPKHGEKNEQILEIENRLDQIIHQSMEIDKKLNFIENTKNVFPLKATPSTSKTQVDPQSIMSESMTPASKLYHEAFNTEPSKPKRNPYVPNISLITIQNELNLLQQELNFALQNQEDLQKELMSIRSPN